MEDIEGISQEEFDYLLVNPEELNVFLQSPANRQLLTAEQLAQALEMPHRS